MKTGRTLIELAQELERQQETKKDYIADTRSLQLDDDGQRLLVEDVGEFEATKLCHHQVAKKVGIPRKYYERMQLEAPQLLASNVNHWFADQPQKRMVRTLDGRARAFLSDRYRPLDNFDLANAVLPKLQEIGASVMSCDVTETRLYLKCVTERITAEVAVGDTVQAGLVISNSEVGKSSIRVSPLVYRLVCKNGAIVNTMGLRKFHIGRAGNEELEKAAEFYRDETRKADDKAFWMKIRDVVAGTVDEVKFKTIVQEFQRTAEMPITADPVKVVENVAEHYGFNEDERGGVLRHLIEGGDLTAYGMLNAITAQSQKVASYDRATEMEIAGGSVIELSQNQWDGLNKVA